MPKVLEIIGYSPVEIGILFGAAPLIRFIVPLMFIRGFSLGNTSFFVALFILFLSVIGIYSFIHDFYLLFLSNIAFGFGLSLILPYVELISLEEIGKELYGKSRLFGSIGFMLVALVLVKFLTNEYVALYYLLTTTFLTIFFALLVIKVSKSTKVKNKDIKNDVNLFKDWRLWLGFALMQMSFGAFYNFFTLYETKNGLSLDMTIYLWSFGVLIEIFMLYIQGRFLKYNLLRVMEICIAATVIRWFLVFVFASNIYILFFTQSLHALSFALFHTASISYLFYHYKNKPLSQQLFSGISYGLGGLIGSITAGLVYEYFFDYLFLYASLIAFLAYLSIYSYRIHNTD